MNVRAVIKSCGAYLPQKIVTNADLEKIVETSDEWIVQRSGIHERRMAAQDERTSDLAIAAGRAAMEQGGFKGSDIDTVLVATSTPDRTFPSTAVTVQAGLSIPRGIAFDLQAVCSGFVYGLSVADAMIRAGQSKRILLIGAEKMTSILNWQDRTTCVLFGDGAGAVVLEAENATDGRGILSTHIYADGTLSDILYVDGGPGSTQTCGHIVMNGKEVFRHAVTLMAEVVQETLEKNNLSASQIDWLVPHQANTRIIEATAKKLELDMSKVVLTVAKHGNTSAASIPLALAEAVQDGRIKRGDLLLLEALGAGLTWGAALVRF